MAVCDLCNREMLTGASCTVTAIRIDGQLVDLAPHGSGPRRRRSKPECGDCGVERGGYHHPGCDMQPCPICRGQLISCGCAFDDDDFDQWEDLDGPMTEPLGVDGNGLLTERMKVGDQEVIIHRDDYPESDITEIDGVRCTTALRTVIDCAPDLTQVVLVKMVQHCLERGLFTVPEAWRRIGEPDMIGRRGAEMLRRVLPPHAA